MTIELNPPIAHQIPNTEPPSVQDSNTVGPQSTAGAPADASGTALSSATSVGADTVQISSAARDISMSMGNPVNQPPVTAAGREMASPDTVHVSSAARDYEMSMGKLVDRVNATPDSRTARVQGLTEAVAQGTYTVSAERIADAMLTQATSKSR